MAEGDLFRGEGRTSAGQLRRAKEWLTERQEKKKEKAISFSLMVFLIVISLLGVLAKIFGGAGATMALIISGSLAFIFFFLVHKNGLFFVLVIATLTIDVVSIEFLSRLPGELAVLGHFLIAIKLFIWVILALVLFFLDLIEYKEEGKELPKWLTLVIVLMVIVLLALVVPMYKGYGKQIQNYDEVAQVKESVVKLAAEGQKLITTQILPPYLSLWFGIGCGISEPMSRDQCIKKRTAAYTCKPFQKEGEDNAEYIECMQAESGEKTTASGIVDPKMNEPLKFEWVPGKLFEQSMFVVSSDQPAFSATLKIANPREAQLNLELSCSWLDLADNREFSGAIFSPKKGEKFTTTKLSEEISDITCSPSEPLKSEQRYKVVYKTKLVDFTTTSYLQVLFVGGDKTQAEKDSLLADHPLAGRSRAAKDLARLNFGLGGSYVEAEEFVALSTAIENIGGGKIVEVKKAAVRLNPKGMASGDLTVVANPPCGLIEKEETLSIPATLILTQKDQKMIQGELCFLKLSENLKGPKETTAETMTEKPTYFLKIVEFESELIYSYEIEAELTTPEIKIIKPGETTTPTVPTQ